MRVHDRNRDQQIKERVDRVRQYIDKVEFKTRHLLEEKVNGGLIKEQMRAIAKIAEKTIEVEKRRKRLEKELKTEINEKLTLEFVTVQANKKNLKRAEKDKYAYLMDKDKQRDTSVQDLKIAMMEDIQQKKEIALLRKMDQEENLRRGQHFNNLEK